MNISELTQTEADLLIAMEKHRVDNTPYDFPVVGGSIQIPLCSCDKREEFILDIRRSRINLKKTTLQNRAMKTIVLVRVDLSGAPHRNPDGTEVMCPHLHIYREGFSDKWAISLPPDKFCNPDDTWNILNEFMDYCSITKKPNINKEFFI